jgi:transglutaminase-like putative cysteine protease
MNRQSWLLPAAMLSVFMTMTTLAQVFSQQHWLFPGMLAIAVAFAAGWFARRLDVPAVLSPALSLLALTALLGIVFHPGTTALGFPTAATMHAIGDSLSQSWRDIRELAAPATPTPALMLLSTTGVFLVAAIVDLQVFRQRRPVAAGLPLLALYLVPTAMTTHANVFVFVFGAIGYLTLLVAEGRDRARAWGRRLSGVEHADEIADLSHVARVGRRIGSAAVGIALCVPLVVPTVGKGIFTGSGVGPFGSGHGSHTITVPNPIVEIRGRLQDPHTEVLMTVNTSSPEYLRLTPLEVFNGAEWRFVEHQEHADHRVGRKKTIPDPDAFGEVLTTRGDYVVSVRNFASRWLPLPYAPTDVDVAGDWRYEEFGYSVFSTETTTKGLNYAASAKLPIATPEQMEQPGASPAWIAPYLKVPKAVPPIVQQVLDEVIGKQKTSYQKARALNEYFRGGAFTYDLSAPAGWNTEALAAFLESKHGYCEQFAGTMAYLARLAGIPARVVVGFTPGRPTGDGVYEITNHDAHAWPELWFPHTGWVRFEPTPRAGTDVPGYAQPVTPPATGDPGSRPTASPTSRPTPTATPSGGHGAQEAKGDDEPSNPGIVRNVGKRVAPLVPLGSAVALVVLLAPSTTGLLVRRRRRSRARDHVGRIHAAWATFADAAEDAGYPLRAADSPRAAARRLVELASLTGSPAEEVARLAAAEERARYARSAPPVDGLDGSVRTVRRALRASLPRVTRARSVAFPASALRRIGEGTRQAGETVDRTRTRIRTALLGLVRRKRTA